MDFKTLFGDKTEEQTDNDQGSNIQTVDSNLPVLDVADPEPTPPVENRPSFMQGSPESSQKAPQEVQAEDVDPSLPVLDVGLPEAPTEAPGASEEDPTLPVIDVEGPDFNSGTGMSDEQVKKLVEAPAMPEGKTSLSADDIRTNPERMSIVRDYLRVKNGVSADNLSDEEAYGQWATGMRWMGANEVSLLSNMRTLANASDEDKIKIGKAYSQWDQLGNVFGNDGVGGALSGIKDYALATALAPTTWIGFGVGSVLTKAGVGATKTALIKQSFDVAAEAAAKSAATNAAKTLVVKNGARLAQQKAATEAVKQVAAQGAKSYAIKQGLITGATEGAINGLSDFVYQQHMMDAGTQDEYSAAESLIASSMGILAGGISGRQAYKGLYNELVYPQVIKEGNEAYRMAKAQYTLTPAQIKANIKVVNDSFVNWANKVKNGKALAVDKLSDTQGIFELLMARGGQGGEVGLLPRLMKDAGYVIDDSSEASYSQQVLTFAHELLDDETKDAVNEAMKDSFGFTMSQATDVVSNYIHQGAINQQGLAMIGKELGTLSATYKAAKKNSLMDSFIPEKLNETALVRGMHYTQNLWRRALVAHPATTAVNVLGYGQAKIASELAQVMAGSYHGTIGLAAKMAKPFSASAEQLSNTELAKAGAIFKSQAYMLNNLLSPAATKAKYEAFLDSLPDKYSVQLRRSTGQGIAGANVYTKEQRDGLTKSIEEASANRARNFKFNGKTYSIKEGREQLDLWRRGVVENTIVKGTEGYIERANTFAGVRLQDSVTKSLSMMESMDRQLRATLGKSFEETMRTVGSKGIPDDIIQKAINESLEDTFSADYTKGNDLLKGIAQFVEKASNTPGVGFVIPFGRFMNNASSFIFRYSPIGYVRPFINKDVGWSEAISQATVGSTWLAYMIAQEKEKAERGIPWFVTEGEDGTQYDQTNLAPGAWFHIMGRLGYHALQGENIADKDFLKDMMAQAGSIGLPSSVDKSLTSVTQGINNIIDWSLGNGDEDQVNSGKGALEVIGASLAGIGAGFTRPLEPLNVALGGVNGTDYNIDRTQLEGGDLVISQATRYVDQLFSVLGGSVGKDESKPLGPVKHTATNANSGQDPNPYGKLFGYRIRQPQSSVEKMFGETTMAEWRANQRTAIPGLDAVVNEKVFTYLEPRAEKLMASDAWKMANNERRRAMATALLENSRKDVQKWIEARPGSNTDLDLQRRKMTNRSKQYVQSAAKHFGIEKPVKEMSYYELTIMNTYMDMLEQYDKKLLK